MWDDSTLPMYDGSLTSNIILISLYLRFIVYWIAIIFGIVAMIVFIFSPFIITYFGIKSLKIKITNYEKNITKKKDKTRKEKHKTSRYLNRLENNISKKEK